MWSDRRALSKEAMTTQGESASNSGPKLHRVAVIGAQKNASQHLSNERTYLSYIRTAIALIGFGVATNRFSVFLIQSNEISKHESMGWSLVNLERAGLGMVISGMILVIWAVLNYTRVRRQDRPRKFPA